MKSYGTLLAAVLILLLSVSAHAEAFGYQGIGPRMGFTINPDQFHFGGQIDFGDIAPNLMLVPNFEIGFGDDETVFTPTFELDYRFRSNWGAWTPYVGGGMGPVFDSPKYGRSSTDIGLYAQGGIGRNLSRINPTRFFMEFKIGLIDAPDAKFTVGWTFHR
jgi:hypothetical protein